ncbi:MAG: 50S ribosomal protein L11 methyltransferase [Muribaculaceae bacterium]|nr:50S ribosomal protein L11 methyltransferase [Muribaculaceae bacterium]
MNDYHAIHIGITPASEAAADVIAALLAPEGYESFVPDETPGAGLTAYVRAEAYDPAVLDEVLAGFPLPGFSLTASGEFIEGRDWNSEWEKNYFQPIVVADKCVIHSSFHTDIPKCEHDITIDPKMAFGTGHHATTSLIIEQLLLLDLRGKAVTDMGTGTGILAILAAMRGASPVSAIEIDPAAEINAEENVRSNGHPEIDVRLGDASLLPGLPKADLFIANINRNIITGDLPSYAENLKAGGTMLLCGFYEHDIPVVLDAARPLGLSESGHTVKGDNWTCLRLTKNA